MAPRACSTDARKSASLSSCDGSRARASMASPARDRFEVTGSVQREDGIVTQVLHGLGRGGEGCLHRSEVGLGPQGGEAGVAKRCQREATHCLHHPVELEGLQGTCMHSARRRAGGAEDRGLLARFWFVNNRISQSNTSGPVPSTLPRNTRRAYGVDGNRGRESLAPFYHRCRKIHAALVAAPRAKFEVL